jgi:zinc D-Ala-D-Ala carboxypeptidase
MQISEHFTLEELTASQAAARNNLDNRPGLEDVKNLRWLAGTLEEVRKLVGKPINVSSAYRSPAVNKAVGGTAKSAHIRGLAADITVSGMTSIDLANLILSSDIAFDQLIYEGTWVHLGLADGIMRRQVLTAHFSPAGVTYTQGIS